MMTTRSVGLILILVATSVAIPPGAADHCSDVLGPTHWVCHPDPQTGVDPPLECVQACKVVDVPGVAVGPELPGAWLMRCRYSIPPTVIVPWLEVGGDPGCPEGFIIENVVLELLPPSDMAPGPDETILSFTVGICTYGVTATAYGFGLNDHHGQVPCAVLHEP